MIKVRVLKDFMARGFLSADSGEVIMVREGEEFDVFVHVNYPTGDEDVTFTHEGKKWYAHCHTSPNPFWELV